MATVERQDILSDGRDTWILAGAAGLVGLYDTVTILGHAMSQAWREYGTQENSHSLDKAVPMRGDQHYEKNVYAADPYGRIRHDELALVAEPVGRAIQSDSYGTPRSSEQQYVIKEETTYRADYAGRIRHKEPSFETQKGCQITQQDRLGRKERYKQQYVIKGDPVYQAGSTGQQRYHKPGYVVEPKSSVSERP